MANDRADPPNAQSHPPDSPASTPDSQHAGSSATFKEPKAPKDRNCPFCGQAFTSSSLGRHLDLYIKPKNPKPPDGVHDVVEIRRIRGGITRRQARVGGKGGEGGEGSHGRRESREVSRPEEEDGGSARKDAGKSGERKGKIADKGGVDSPVDKEKEADMPMLFNAPNWMATGVINDLPARAPSRPQNATAVNNNGGGAGGQAQRIQEMRRDTTGNRVERPEYVTEEMWKLQEQAEIGKAAEMALREVMGSLEAAKKKAEPRQLYEDFDFCSMSFPSLCLAILPPPPSLFSSTPFAAPHTWSLAPPGEKQYEAVNRMVHERTAWVRNGKRENLQDTVVFKHHVHLEGSFQHWQSMSDTEKAAAWTLEISRAYVGEKGKKNDLKIELEAAQQRVQHLEAEYDRLSRCQLPREYLLHPPNTIPLSPNVMREMRTTGATTAAAEANYDAEALLNKWKTVVKSTARPPKQNTASGSSPYDTHYIETRRNQMRGDMLLNGSVFAIGGPIPRNTGGMSDIDTVRREVDYATPPASGAIVDAEDGDADADADAEEDDRGGYGDEGALTRFRNTATAADAAAFCAPVNGLLNANGKRPLDPGLNGDRNGRKGSAPKVYKER